MTLPVEPHRPPAKRGPKPRPAHLRVLDRTVREDTGFDTPCLRFIGAKTRGGYGKICTRQDGRVRYELAHRVTYQALRGPIPAGMQLDHLCRITGCVNHDHLEPVTPLENARRQQLSQRGLSIAIPGLGATELQAARLTRPAAQPRKEERRA